MPKAESRDRAVVAAMSSAAAISGVFVAGKAARDALFLARFDLSALPVMVMAGALLSIALVLYSSRLTTRIAPAVFMPGLCLVSAGLLLVEWALALAWPRTATVVFFLQMYALAPLQVSGFWSIVTERFDPRMARRRVGQIAGAGTLGGLAATLLIERVAAWTTPNAVLPLLAILSAWCAWDIRRLALGAGLDGRPYGSTWQALASDDTRSGIRVLRQTPYLRSLAELVLVSTLGAAMLDFVFKAQAVETLGRGDGLLRFFAIYYGATSLLAFIAQTSVTSVALEKLGLVFTTTLPSTATLAGSVGTLIAPGLTSATVARGAEFVSRSSFLRSGYELFYTPVSAADKRAAKAIIDVGFDRVGEVAGGGFIRLALAAAPAAHSQVLLSAAIACAVGGLALARRLHQGYIHALEKSLLAQAVHVDLGAIEDGTTRSVVLSTMSQPVVDVAALRAAAGRGPETGGGRQDAGGGRPEAGGRRREAGLTRDAVDPLVRQIADLRSRDRERVLAALRQGEGPSPPVAPHVIPLLAWDAVAAEAARALQKVAEECVGLLTDALIDPNTEFTVRRRLARVFAVCVSQRAVDGLMLGLEDRFEVRFQCGRSLAAILERNPRVRIDHGRVYKIVLREMSVGRPVWESHRLLDKMEDEVQPGAFVTEVVRDRASQSLAHIFTLLSLVLPREPLQIAFRGLYTDDAYLRGTALEYLESVLPPVVRDRLWPFLEDSRAGKRRARSREEVLADLLRSNDSIMLKLEDLKRHSALGTKH